MRCLTGPFASGTPRQLRVTGTIPTADRSRLVVPDGATGVVLNATAVQATADGFVSITPGDAAGDATTSSLNFRAGEVAPSPGPGSAPSHGRCATRSTVKTAFTGVWQEVKRRDWKGWLGD